MPSVTARSVSRTLHWPVSAILVLWALFSPVLGPMMDHHFAERQHNHAHIYFGTPDIDHLHPYVDHHDHRIIRWANDEQWGDAQAGTDVSIDVVFLAPLDGMGQNSLALLTPAMSSMNTFPDQGNSNLFLEWRERYVPLQEAHVPPPKKPPRA